MSQQQLHYQDCYKFNEVKSFTSDVNPQIMILERNSPPLTTIRKPPAFIDDYANFGWATGVAAARPIKLDDNFCYRVTNAKIMGHKAVILEDGGYLEDDRIELPDDQIALMQKRTNRHDTLHHQDGDLIEENGLFYSKKIVAPNHHIKEPTVSLCSNEPSNYGSWLFRILPKIYTMRWLGLGKFKVFCYCPQPWQINLLKMTGIREEQIICQNVHHVYLFDELYVPSIRNSQAYLHQDTITFYQNITNGLNIQREKKDLIYLSRNHHAKSVKRPAREFLNELELCDKLSEIGFKIICPETLPLLEQIKTFANAAFIVTPSGSAMFNVVFCPDNAFVVDFEAFPYWLHAHTNLFASNNLDYGLIIGEVNNDDDALIHKSWRLNVPKTIDRIKQLI
jgi:Glycosyltransferase 61